MRIDEVKRKKVMSFGNKILRKKKPWTEEKL